MIENKKEHRKLYFVKVDIKSCFDRIPQRKVLGIAQNLISEDSYVLGKYVELVSKHIGPKGNNHHSGSSVTKKFINMAKNEYDCTPFQDFALEKAARKRNMVFVEKISSYQAKDCKSLTDLLEEHVECNLVKVSTKDIPVLRAILTYVCQIGNKYFRQKRGIPQGSLISPLLCSLHYGDLEHELLPFADDEDGVMARMADDFIFITLNRRNAQDFLEIMYHGVPDYGAFVSPDKCLVNFDAEVDGVQINKLEGTPEFPYCGLTINTKSLEIKRDYDKRENWSK